MELKLEVHLEGKKKQGVDEVILIIISVILIQLQTQNLEVIHGNIICADKHALLIILGLFH